MNSGRPVDVGTVLLTGGATGLIESDATGGATIWKVVDTVGAGSESVNRPPVGCSYTVVVTLGVQEVLRVDESWRVTVVVTLRVQDVLVGSASLRVQDVLLDSVSSESPAGTAVLVAGTLDETADVET